MENRGKRASRWLPCLAWLAAAWLAIAGLATTVVAAPSAEQRSAVRSAETAIRKASNLYRSKKYAEAGQAIDEAQAALADLAGEDARELTALTAPLLRQIERARERLKAEGVEIEPAAAMPAAAGAKSAAGTVSFTKQVASVLVAKCGSCHIQRSRGEFNMSTYVALAKGSASGTVIMAGDARGSRLVEVIESGDMPRGGAKVSSEELALLIKWIDEGAKFDGPDSAAPLTSFSAGGLPDQPPPRLMAAQASGKEEVQFARDLGQTLLNNCIECHGELNPRNNFSIRTFNRLLQGGTSGPALAPGKPEESLLVDKLRGKAGERMPLNRPPLPEEEIAKIEKWIALGAKFDGADPAMSLEETIGQTLARQATHDELSRRRAELAEKNWRLILPDAQANREETPNVLVLGSVGGPILADVARIADQQIGRLRKQFKLADDEPFIKGRLTLFVFDKRYDYGEVGTMLEQRELPTSWRGHWYFDPLNAYACILLSGTGEASPSNVAQQVAGAYVASLGRVPRWFAEGTARAVAAKIDPKDPRVKLWDEQTPRILSSASKPDAFLTASLPPEDSDILGYSYVKFLMTSSARHTALITLLREGMPFDQAFVKAYGGNPTEHVQTWANRVTKRGR